MNPQLFFDRVASELMSGPPHPGLWARAYALTDGDLARARARYIILRVQQIEVEFLAEIEARRQDDSNGKSVSTSSPKSAPDRSGWPYLNEDECVVELARYGRTVSKTGKSSWLVTTSNCTNEEYVSSIYDFQRIIAQLWRGEYPSNAA